MTVAKQRFISFEEYLALDPADLPEGRFEYWDGELIPVMSESIGNDAIANFLFLTLVGLGIPFRLVRPHSCEVAVPGRPRTRYPDLVVLQEMHLTLLGKRATVTQDMPPPKLVAEVVSPGGETSENYRRDYEEKAEQHAAIGVREYWLIDPERSVVWVGVLMAGAYQFKAFRDLDRILSMVVPSFGLTVEALLESGQ